MGYSTRQFMDNVRTQRFGNFSDWREKGKTVGWIHPEGFVERQLHNMMIYEAQDKNGNLTLRGNRFTCSGKTCPFCALVEYAKDLVAGMDEGDSDPVILAGRIPPKDRSSKELSISYSLRELAGGGDWKRRMGARPEFIFGWIPRDGRKSDAPVELMNVTSSLAQAIKRVIQSQIEDRGEQRGDPLQTPYALKFTYNEDASPGQMYTAERVDNDLAPLDEAVEQILDTKLERYSIDLDRLAKLSDPRVMLDSIEFCWQSEDYPFKNFLKFYRTAFDVPGEEDEAPAPKQEAETRSSRKSREEPKEYDEKAYGKAVAEEVDEREGRRKRAEPEPEPAREAKSWRRTSTPPPAEEPAPRRRRPQEEELPVEEERPATRRREAPEPYSRPIPAAGKEPAPSGRRAAEPAPASKPASGPLIECKECGNRVHATKYGKCPECGAELDVPY